MSETPSPKKSGGCVKGCLIGCLVATLLTAITLAIGGYIAYSQISKYLDSSTAPKHTTLEIVSGSANVKPGPIVDGTTITTGPKSLAIVTFTNSSQLRLDEQTTVTIKSSADNLALLQTLGRTWTRFINLTGKDTFTIESPTAVATVRGTAFSTAVTSTESILDVVEGTVIINDASVTAGSTATTTAKTTPPTIVPLRSDFTTSPWFTTNTQLDLELQTKLKTSPLNPLELLAIAKSVKPDDIATLRTFATRLQSGNFQLTEAQLAQLEPIAKRLESNPTPADIAQILVILDPQLFADQAHWIQVISSLMPIISKLDFQDSLRFESVE